MIFPVPPDIFGYQRSLVWQMSLDILCVHVLSINDVAYHPCFNPDLHFWQWEKKRVEIERVRAQRRRWESEAKLLEAQELQEQRDLAALTDDLGRFGVNGMGGHQSEPTTPPEYSSGFPTMFSRPNRYSTSSLTSPQGLYNRPARSGSQLASPQSGIIQSRFTFDDQLPSRSVPGSRRNSDEDEKEEAVRQDPTSHRATNA